MTRDNLTRKQRALYDLLIKGYYYKQIARELDISKDGVRSSVVRLYKLLGVDGKEELIIKHYEELLEEKDKEMEKLKSDLEYYKYNYGEINR